MSKIKFFALGGLDEIGKNLYVLEINDKIIILDAGAKYPAKNIPGVDLIIPSFKYLEENKKRVAAYIITHGHQEEMGAIPFMYKFVPAPIYCSKFTRDSILSFGAIYEVKQKYEFITIDDTPSVTIADIKVAFTQLTHSIPGCFSVRIYTDQGAILYIPDFICDPTAREPFNTDYKSFEFGHDENFLALILDSTSATRKGYTIPTHRCYDLLLRDFENTKGKIIIANIYQNLFNVQEILKLCEKFNKTVFIYDKNNNQNAITSIQKSFVDYKICTPKIKFGKFDDLNKTREQDIVILILDDRNTIYDNLKEFIEVNRFKYRIEINENDLIINNCQPIPTKETFATEIFDLFYKTDAKIKTISSKERNMIACAEEDIKQYLTFIQPKYFIPVGGYYFQMMASAKLALNSSTKYSYSNIFLLDNGVVLNFENRIAKPDFRNKIETSDLFIDGIDIGNVGNNVIEERAKMSNDGIVLMAVSISKSKKEICGGPDVQMRGFVFLKDSENILRQITSIFVEQVNIYLTGFYDDKQIVLDNIVEKAIRYVRKETGKNPVIIPQIIELD